MNKKMNTSAVKINRYISMFREVRESIPETRKPAAQEFINGMRAARQSIQTKKFPLFQVALCKIRISFAIRKARKNHARPMFISGMVQALEVLDFPLLTKPQS